MKNRYVWMTEFLSLSIIIFLVALFIPAEWFSHFENLKCVRIILAVAGLASLVIGFFPAFESVTPRIICFVVVIFAAMAAEILIYINPPVPHYHRVYYYAVLMAIQVVTLSMFLYSIVKRPPITTVK